MKKAEPIATLVATGTNDNLFDPEQLRLAQDFGAMVGVKKALLTVPVRKPDRQWFFRIHPDESWRLTTAIFEDKVDREIYLVDRSLFGELPGEIVAETLFTAINRQGVVFLWPVKLPQSDGRQDAWKKTSMEAAELGMKKWVRVAANMSLGAYEVFEASGEFPAPVWPEVDFPELLKVAFRDKFIRNIDHPVLRRLRGEL